MENSLWTTAPLRKPLQIFRMHRKVCASSMADHMNPWSRLRKSRFGIGKAEDRASPRGTGYRALLKSTKLQSIRRHALLKSTTLRSICRPATITSQTARRRTCNLWPYNKRHEHNTLPCYMNKAPARTTSTTEGHACTDPWTVDEAGLSFAARLDDKCNTMHDDANHVGGHIKAATSIIRRTRRRTSFDRQACTSR